jgi:hypothetical protein
VAGQFKPYGQIRADTPLAVQHPRERDAGHGKPFGSVGHRQPQRSNYIFPEDFARMRRTVHHLSCSFGSAPTIGEIRPNVIARIQFQRWQAQELSPCRHWPRIQGHPSPDA